jgi:hypothetical protein
MQMVRRAGLCARLIHLQILHMIFFRSKELLALYKKGKTEYGQVTQRVDDDRYN